MKIENKEGINYFHVTNKKKFKQIFYVSNLSISKAFEFAYQMAPELHREYRTGGNYTRQPNEIFINTFTGKLAEFALYEYLTNYGIVATEPDLKIYPRRIWDDDDFTITSKINNEYKINVKSTKHFGNLLLLEAGDYDKNGTYTPNDTSSDYYVFVRLEFDLERKMKSIKSFSDNTLMEKGKLKLLINETIKDIEVDDDLDRGNK